MPGLPLQTESAALRPGSVCKLLFTHANAAFCCSRHQNGVLLLPFAQASRERTTQAVLASWVLAVFAPHPPSHLWSPYQFCFHPFFFFFLLSLCLPIYRWCFCLCSQYTCLLSCLLSACQTQNCFIRAARINYAAAAAAEVGCTRLKASKKLKRQHRAVVRGKHQLITQVVHAAEAKGAAFTAPRVGMSLLPVKLGMIFFLACVIKAHLHIEDNV